MLRRPHARIRHAIVLLAASLAAGCQTAPQADPESTVTVGGNFQELAGCYAQSQDTASSRPVTGTDGTRTASVTITEAAPAAADALGGTVSKSAQEVLGTAGAASYRVTFREMPDNRTQVSGSSLGAATKPFLWFENVLPALRQCSGDPDLR